MSAPMSEDSGHADSDPLYLVALAVERDAALNDEMAEWEAATIGDGFSETTAPNPDRRGRWG